MLFVICNRRKIKLLVSCILFTQITWADSEFQRGVRPKKKIGVFTVCRPTLFYSCGPYHLFSENKKKRDSFPVLLQWSRILVSVFKIFADSIWYVVKPFTDTFGFCQSKMATFSSLFFSKNDHHDQKSLFEATSHHQMTWDI